MTKPNGLCCTYCGLFFHSECSSTFVNVSHDVLCVVKKVCTPCPNCETSLKDLPLRVSKLEQKFAEFVAKTETSAVGPSTLHSSVGGNACTVAPVDVSKAVKEAISAHDEKFCVIVSGVKETGSVVTDKAAVKKVFDSICKDSVVLIDAFRLGKESSESSEGLSAKPRLVKVRVGNANQRTAILRKAKILKESVKFKNVFIRPSHTSAERSHIRTLYEIMQTKRTESGQSYYIDRRGPVSQWMVRESKVRDSNSSDLTASGRSGNV